MYRRPRFLEILIKIREEMAREADFDVDLFVENLRTGHRGPRLSKHSMEKEMQNRTEPGPKRAGRPKKKS
jgi:hypothetical protein